MASWRVARSLDTLLAQLNKQAPNRSKISDGSIASNAHTVANPNSDHEPWIKLAGVGIVTARDFTNDPKGGLDCNWLAARLVASGDPRIKYVIWNRRIWTARSGWQPYKGINPHDHHLHLSVSEQPGWFDSTLPWAAVTGSTGSPITTLPVQEDDVPSQEEWNNFTKDVWATLARMEAKIEASPGAVLFSRFTSADGQQRNIPDFLIEGLRQQVALSQKYDARPAGPVVTASVDYGKIATTVADEADRRARDGDPATGPRT